MKIFSPQQIGPLELKNRIVMAPMATHYADETGAVTERLKNYYLERARGGAGLIIVESGTSIPWEGAGRGEWASTRTGSSPGSKGWWMPSTPKERRFLLYSILREGRST
jgi:2,4-dienoyl-CoA reductase-like NADH-dependent reductase (Old Yellow Enzyme family)